MSDRNIEFYIIYKYIIPQYPKKFPIKWNILSHWSIISNVHIRRALYPLDVAMLIKQNRVEEQESIVE